ncbi:TetR/AcrR family transcriptional regulator [Saccharospirillum salsuginis]|uniref:HTH tetR-type domain-containing protein n=1 Tax=Saccharospirillum salsuginis TaxID=418750 RepID=A0A918K778_9GAMM|nr:TetR/AcrR family transcriptional regulator [Saccharospirillum salsuginis]GGX51933.1 hypothetical protein GCM10007392_19060 [Saccharospirillum salsuginis]
MLHPVLQVKDQHPTETAILNSALNLFMLSGEDQVSVTRLIQTAGISRSVFYHYFSGKEDIYAALLLADEIGVGPILRKHLEAGSLSGLMKEYVKYRLQSVEKHRFFVRVEEKLLRADCQLERFVQWQRLRRNHIELFSECARKHHGVDKGSYEDNLRFYYGLVWALTSGVASLSGNDLYHEMIPDKRGFVRFLAEAVAEVGEASE